MDDKRFDALAKMLVSAASRRGVARGVVGGAFAAVVARASAGKGAAQERAVGTESCAENGQICSPRRRLGTGHLHSCNQCCSDYSVKVNDGRRRCSCKPAGQECAPRKGFQCCSGVCNARFCTGRSELVERGEGTITRTSPEGCQFTEAGCTSTIAGTVEGRPIDGTFAGTLTGTNFQDQGGGDFTSDVRGTVTLTDDSSGDALEVEFEGEQSANSASGESTFDGTFTIVGGTGRFVGASGSGTIRGTDTDGNPETLDSVVLRGTITTAG